MKICKVDDWYVNWDANNDGAQAPWYCPNCGAGIEHLADTECWRCHAVKETQK